MFSDVTKMNHSDNFPPTKLIETLLVRNDFQFFPVCRVFSISGVFFVRTNTQLAECLCSLSLILEKDKD